MTFDFVSCAIQKQFNLLTPFELEADLGDGTKCGRVKINSTNALLSVLDSSNNQCRINVYNLINEASPFILVKLFEVDDNSSLNDVDRSFKWQPIHLSNDSNNDSETEEDWECEYNRLINLIRLKFSINLLSKFRVVQAKEGENSDESKDDEVKIDCDELECIWSDLNDDDNGNNKSDISITFKVILDRNKDNAMKFTTNKPKNDEYDHKMIEEVRSIFILLHLLFK